MPSSPITDGFIMQPCQSRHPQSPRLSAKSMKYVSIIELRSNITYGSKNPSKFFPKFILFYFFHTFHSIVTESQIVADCMSKICCEDMRLKRVYINAYSCRFARANFSLCRNSRATIFKGLSPEKME